MGIVHEDNQGKRTLSTEESNAPKRRSSTARRRRKRAQNVAATNQQAEAQVSKATTETAEPVERHIQRREERKAAKAQSEKKGMAKVVDAERFSGVRGFYEDTMSEIRKVIWPDRTQTRNLTLVVIAMSVVMGTLLGGIDWVLLQLFENVA